MDFDIRIPIALLFLILGALICVYGLIAPQALFLRHSLGLNVDLYWGAVMAVFGGGLVVLVAVTRSRR